jgi:hypothetical protein
MSNGAWIKLSVGWDEDERVATLPYLTQLVWLKVLTRAKRQRPGGAFGSIDHLKALLPAPLHRHITPLVKAGLLGEQEGRLVVINWGKHQIDPTRADRVSRFRERERNGYTGVQKRPDIEREKDKEKERERDNSIKPNAPESVGEILARRVK